MSLARQDPTATDSPPAPAERGDDLLRWLSCATAVAIAMVAARSVAPTPADGSARAFSALVALAGVLALAPASLRRVPAPSAWLGCGVGALAGLLCFPLWGATLIALGGALGLSPVRAPALPPDAGTLLAIGLLAPAFEELLYRGWLLPLLVARFGWPLAVLASSAAFALPHGDAWGRLTALVLGSTLALSMRFGTGLGACVGAHAGLNLAFLLRDGLDWADRSVALPAAGGALWLGWLALERRDQSRNARARRRLRGSSVSGSRSR